MNTRRDFIKNTAISAVAVGTALAANQTIAHPRPQKNKVSLATWSINRTLFSGVHKLTDVARICREEFDIDGIEHVNQFFEVPTSNYLNKLNQQAKEYGVENVLIMVDHEGSLVSTNKAERKQAVINHRKWVDIAAYLSCHSIRCNAYGGANTFKEDPDSINRAAESFSELVEYAIPAKINIIIENHGRISSDPDWLPALMKKVDSPHFGTLPDYGNYGEGIDRYEAIRKSMPFAKGVSVKSSWNNDKTHPRWDLEKLLNISLDAGYTGFWGIESGIQNRGTTPQENKENEFKAVKWTKEVIDKVVMK
jgi:L-ribulose-5-phosphate 3-epimerase